MLFTLEMLAVEVFGELSKQMEICRKQEVSDRPPNRSQGSGKNVPRVRVG
jgi:hypothetical protein